MTLEIIAFKDESLPRPLQKLFPDWKIQRTAFYAIYTIELPCLGDEHLEPLDKAFKSKSIQGWTATEGWSSANFNL